jgi:hypothetical protein
MRSVLRRNYLLWAVGVLIGIGLMRGEAFAQIDEKYQVMRIPFTVVDRDNRPFSGYSVGVRLDLSSPNQPEDETITATTEDETVYYGKGETYRKYGPIDGQGKVLIPFVVYGDREDCIGYEIALFFEGEQVDPKTKKECLALDKVVSTTFVASIRVPTPWTTWVKYGVYFLILAGFVTFGIYKPFYAWQLRGTDDPQDVTVSRHRASSLLLFLIAVIYGVMFFVLLPHNLMVWVIFVLLAVLWILHFVFAVLLK